MAATLTLRNGFNLKLSRPGGTGLSSGAEESADDRKRARSTRRRPSGACGGTGSAASEVADGEVSWRLRERVKELTALHSAAEILHEEHRDLQTVLQSIAALLPPAFQYPEVTAARLRLGEIEILTPGFG